MVVSLKPNEVLGMVEGHVMPITCDSGAEISVVPEECVGQDRITGETCTVQSFNKGNSTGKECVISFQVGDRVFSRTAVTQPGESISWTACLSVSLACKEEMMFLMDRIARKETLPETDLSYMPPRIEEGVL